MFQINFTSCFLHLLNFALFQINVTLQNGCQLKMTEENTTEVNKLLINCAKDLSLLISDMILYLS